MTGRDIFRMAFGNLARRKGRAALTAAGVVVGVATLILMVSLGLGLRREVMRLFTTQDELRTIRVSRIRMEQNNEPTSPLDAFMLTNQIIPLTRDNLEEMRGLPGVDRVRPVLDMVLRVKANKGVMPAQVAGYQGRSGRLSPIWQHICPGA